MNTDRLKPSKIFKKVTERWEAKTLRLFSVDSTVMASKDKIGHRKT